MATGLRSHSSAGGEDWVLVQKKTFTRWANSYLSKRQLEVIDLSEDLKDGTKLGALLEVISNERLNKLNPSPKIEIQKLENLNKCLEFLKDKVHLVNIGSQDIFKGNEKLILGLLWTIILRFEVGDQEGKNGLLLWVQRSCKGYNHVDPPNVQNFTNDWSSGLAFCAIIHRYRPDLLDYNSLRPSNAEENCELAFSIAESKLGIQRFLDVADVANHPRPDEKSIIAYVSQFFKLFAKASKNDALLKSIRNAVEVTKRHEALVAKYDSGANEVASWTSENAQKMASGSASTNTEQVKAELDEFTSYMRTIKPNMQSTRAEVEGTATQLINSKRNNKRPAFEPAVSTQSLADAWSSLEEVESAREKMLLDKYRRFQQVDNEESKISGRAASMKTWLDEQLAKFSNVPSGLSLTQLESEIEVQDGFDSRLAQYKEVLQELQASAARVQELGQGEHEACSQVATQIADLSSLVEAASQAGAQHRAALESAVASEREAIQLERLFKRKAGEVDFDLDQIETLAKQPIVVSSAADVNELTAALGALRKQAAESKAIVDGELSQTSSKLKSRRPEFDEHVAVEKERCSSIEASLAAREKMLAEKLAEETTRDALRAEFAAKANALAPKIASISDKLSSVTGELENQLDEVRSIREEIVGALKSELDQVDAIAVKCDAAGIVNNPQTTHTIFSLRASYDQILKAANDEEGSLNTQILAKKALEVSPEQLKEIREVFHFFDSDNTGAIGLAELKEACTGAGIDLEEAEIERRMKERKANMSFTVDDFTAFMLAELKQGDTLEHVMSAFQQLGNGAETMDQAAIESAFQTEPDLKAFVSERMQDGNIKSFVENLFSI